MGCDSGPQVGKFGIEGLATVGEGIRDDMRAYFPMPEPRACNLGHLRGPESELEGEKKVWLNRIAIF